MFVSGAQILSCALALVITFTTLAGTAAAENDVVQLTVPYRSQLDGDPYEDGNCGPATLSMVLEAYGKEVSTGKLRAHVNNLQGTWGMYDEGTRIENLGVIAEREGLQAQDLYEGKRLRRWTLDDVRRHLKAGHPVVPQVWFRGLPGREKRPYNGDHYIALIGYEGTDFIYNDSIDYDVPGANRRISAAQLERAWRNSDFPYAALAIAGTDGQRVPSPTPTIVPTATRIPSPTATVTPSPSTTPTPELAAIEVGKAADTDDHPRPLVVGGGLASVLGIAVFATVWRRKNRR